MNRFFTLDLLNRFALVCVPHRFPVTSVCKPGGKLTRISALKYANELLPVPLVIHPFASNRSVTAQAVRREQQIWSKSALGRRVKFERAFFALKESIEERLIEYWTQPAKGESRCRSKNLNPEATGLQARAR